MISEMTAELRPTTVVRGYTPDDDEELLGVLRDVYAAGYPHEAAVPRSTGLPRWLHKFPAQEAFVAERDARIVGFCKLVRIQDTFRDLRMFLAGAGYGWDDAPLMEVSRLFVSPQARGAGAGTGLLRTASEASRAVGRIPVLSVNTSQVDAIRLYDREGWVRLGEFGGVFGVPVAVYANVL